MCRMTKEEAKVFLKQKMDEGYITQSTLLELYHDGEEVDEDVLELMYEKPKGREYVIYCGEALANLLKQIK